MRGAGCVINDMWDSDIDKKVFVPYQWLCVGVIIIKDFMVSQKRRYNLNGKETNHFSNFVYDT